MAPANPEDIDLDGGDVEEEAADAVDNIQLETKPVPVRYPYVVFWSFPRGLVA